MNLHIEIDFKQTLGLLHFDIYGLLWSMIIDHRP